MKKSTKIAFLLPADLLEQVKKFAAPGGETISSFTRVAVVERVDRLRRLRSPDPAVHARVVAGATRLGGDR